MIEFFGLKNCDTCKKALKALSARYFNVTDVRADGVSEAMLAEWVSRVGADTLINRRSTTWRGLDEVARSKAETEVGAVDLLAANPTLIKRPVIIYGDQMFIGWTKDAQAALV
jgi:arsenate reductase